MDLFLARPSSQSDKAHGIGVDIGLGNSHRGDPAGIRVRACAELYSFSRLIPNCLASATMPFWALSQVR
jgi:hypothetical protein